MWDNDPQKPSSNLSSRFEGEPTDQESNIGGDIEEAIWTFAGVDIKNVRNAD